MRDLQTLREKKKALGLTNALIADLSGVPLGTVQKVFSGVTKSPGSRTILAIERVLFPQETSPGSYPSEKSPLPDMLCESPAAYGAAVSTAPPRSDGEYTYADYVALPDDRRVELIDGHFYDMAAPNSKHQIILGQLYMQFQACMQNHPDCMVLLSPLDVMLDGNDRTVVQPDLLVVCDRSKMRKGRVFGAPDLVIEIVSPGSHANDYCRKAFKYIYAGVREYWIVDFKKRHVLIYRNEEELDVSLSGTEDDIPVGISGGECVIHMGVIQKLLDSLGDI